MNDAAIMFAVLALATIGWVFATALSFALREARGELAVMRSNYAARWKAQKEWETAAKLFQDKWQETVQANQVLRDQLTQARKNDHRDPKGRFAKVAGE